jgi:6-phosphofructokinase 1
MAKELKGSALVAQSGGPTAVINSSAAGVIEAAMKSKVIDKVYGGLNGILGVLREDIYDITKESAEDISNLRRTPSAGLGSCRYKVKGAEDVARVFEVLKAHNIRYFFYAGGNDSMDTAAKVAKLAASQNYELRVMGVAKTVDNDLAYTDHCPGFGSVAKYIATSVMEAGRDTEALYTHDTATIFETMGRNAGWIAASAGLARRNKEDAPDLVYLPERPLTLEKFVADVKAVLADKKRCFVAASEGMVNEKGEYFSTQKGAFGQDAFGHQQLGGVGDVLRPIIEDQAGVKCRVCRPDTAQRNAMHFASLTDVEEAYMVGRKAVEHALAGTSGQMVTLVRESSNPYKCSTGLAKLEDVANGEKKMPDEYINKDGNHITDAFREYATPLIRGEAPITMGKDGLPVYVRLKKVMVAKKLAKWDKA